jgi:TonB family protein
MSSRARHLPCCAAALEWVQSGPGFALNFELLQLFETRHWTRAFSWRAIRSVPGPTSLHTLQTASTPARSGALVDVIVLSAEDALYDAIRDSIGERNPVWRARSAEESVDLLITGRCGVLVVDLASVSVKSDIFIQRIVDQFPDVVVCVAGRREDEPLLASLISDGHVYRFMHKPLSPRRAGMFLQAAIRHHCDRLGDVPPGEPTLRLVATLPRKFDPMKWVFVAVGVAFFVALLATVFGDRPAPPAQEKASPAAPALPAVTHFTSSAPQADPVLSRARAAFESGRLESPPGRNALDLYQAVLLAHPDNAEARAGVDKTLDRIVAAARVALDAGNAAEAQRLVDRALEADPGRRTAALLAQQMKPPDAPPVVPIPQTVIATVPAPAKPVVPTTSVAPATTTGSTTPPVAVPVTRLPPVTPVRVTATPEPASPPAVVRPDPLAPHYANAAVAAVPRTPIYARTVEPLPIAGYVKNGNAEAKPAVEPASELSRGAFAPTGPVLPAESIEQLVVRDPVYPLEALRNHTTGWVQMEFTIAPNGSVGDIAVIEAEPKGVFEQAAATALSHWRFRPRVVNGQPVAQRSTVTLRFDVDG